MAPPSLSVVLGWVGEQGMMLLSSSTMHEQEMCALFGRGIQYIGDMPASAVTGPSQSVSLSVMLHGVGVG